MISAKPSPPTPMNFWVNLLTLTTPTFSPRLHQFLNSVNYTLTCVSRVYLWALIKRRQTSSTSTSSLSTHQHQHNHPTSTTPPVSLSETQISPSEVCDSLINLNSSKVMGIEKIGSNIRRSCACAFYQSIHHLFIASLRLVPATHWVVNSLYCSHLQVWWSIWHLQLQTNLPLNLQIKSMRASRFISLCKTTTSYLRNPWRVKCQLSEDHWTNLSVWFHL